MVPSLLLYHSTSVWQLNNLLQEASSVTAATPSMPESLALAASRISREFGSQEDVLEVSIPIELYVLFAI